jgi:glycosyltransferase involved in cell wall biosynthesis
MRIVHVGPPLERTGGPAGYLLQLRDAARAHGESAHEVRFPPTAARRVPAKDPSMLRRQLARAKRVLVGKPRQYRPTREEMKRRRGQVADLYRRSQRSSSERTMQNLLSDDAYRSADVLFLHDVLAVNALLDVRGDAEVWLMVHSPIPMGLYTAWNWGDPEASWHEIVSLPDVQEAIEEELESWHRVDRLIFPCVEALEELVRVDERFSRVTTPRDYVLSGSSVEPSASSTSSRSAWSLPGNELVGLFLGNGLAYRGLDALVDAVSALPSRRELPGVIAVAGPDPDSLPSHPRLVRLGRVGDVASLLQNVDFLVNTNRFSLFDLSNIEGAAAGKALLLHAVGGNKTLQALGAGCHLFENLGSECLADGLRTMFTKSRDELARWGRSSRECYEKHLTAANMWRRHLKLYDEAQSNASDWSRERVGGKERRALSLDE